MSPERAPRARAALVAALALASGLALAEPPAAKEAEALLAEAIATYQTRDYPSALARLGTLAEAGEPQAQTILGIMYESGEGVSPDPALAAEWYRRAAEQGYDPAQYALANLYRAGRGVPKDPQEAAYWYAAAAQRGNRWAGARIDDSVPGATDPEPPLLARGQRPVPARAPSTGIAADRLDALVARLPSLREARAMREAAAREAADATGVPLALAQVDHSGAKPPAAALAPARIPDSATGSAAPGPVAAAPSGGVAGRAPPPGPVARDRAPIASLSEAVEIVGADAASGAYSVQVAATRSHAQSERELARVTRAVREVLPGADSHVLRVDLGEHSGVWYRARLGAFESVAAAEQACAAIEDRAGTQGCFVTPR